MFLDYVDRKIFFQVIEKFKDFDCLFREVNVVEESFVQFR